MKATEPVVLKRQIYSDTCWHLSEHICAIEYVALEMSETVYVASLCKVKVCTVTMGTLVLHGLKQSFCNHLQNYALKTNNDTIINVYGCFEEFIEILISVHYRSSQTNILMFCLLNSKWFEATAQLGHLELTCFSSCCSFMVIQPLRRQVALLECMLVKYFGCWVTVTDVVHYHSYSNRIIVVSMTTI